MRGMQMTKNEKCLPKSKNKLNDKKIRVILTIKIKKQKVG